MIERIKSIIKRKLSDAKKEKLKCVLKNDLIISSYEQGRINLCQYLLDEIKFLENEEFLK